jgi:HKD family nuclease
MLEFFDNEQESFLKILREALETANQADFCVGYFNLGGWKLIDDLIEVLSYRSEGQCRLLIGMAKTNSQGFLLDDVCTELICGLQPNESRNILEKFAELLKRKRLTIKASKDEIHAKLYLIRNTDYSNQSTCFIGSSNLTLSGLQKTKAEINVRFYGTSECGEIQKWFEKHWLNTSSIDCSQELMDWALTKAPNINNYIIDCRIDDLLIFIEEWNVEYLTDKDGVNYDSFDKKIIRDLIEKHGAENIILPWGNNPNCETVMDVFLRDEQSERYIPSYSYTSMQRYMRDAYD